VASSSGKPSHVLNPESFREEQTPTRKKNYKPGKVVHTCNPST
jgi:hypothetical protein